MKYLHFRKASWLMAATLFSIAVVAAQTPKVKPKPVATSTVVFAVLNDGKLVEPIGAIRSGKIEDLDLGSDDAAPAKGFGQVHYKPRTVYSVIFGGASDGWLTVAKSNIGTECGGATADVATRPIKAKLKGLVMALATNFKNKGAVVSYRRMPTPNERMEIERLAREEFKKKGANDAALKKLNYHNLTALDVDGDNVPEFVGSYWIATTDAERRRLFFVAQGQPGKIAFPVINHAVVTADDVPTNDLKDLDDGHGSDLLLDVLDYDDDGVKEIFLIGQGFEGNNYYVYKRNGEKWDIVFDTYRYRCAF
jgi:hypothetical protein